MATTHRTLNTLGLTQIRWIAAVAPSSAPPLVREVYRDLEQGFGILAPPVVLHAPAPPVLAAVWEMLRTSMLADGPVSRAVREAVAAEVSRANACPYCITVHDEVARRLSGPTPDATDPAAEIARWLVHDSSPPPPFPVAQLPDLVAVVVFLHYLNRMATVFLPEVPLPPLVPRAATGTVVRRLGRIIVEAGRTAPPGPLDPAPALPPELAGDLSWAASRPELATALAQACAVIDAAGADQLPPRVRDLVIQAVHERTTLTGATATAEVPTAAAATARTLPDRERALAVLALRFACAPHQVGHDDLRAATDTDRAAVEIGAWASLTAARRVGHALAAAAARSSPSS